MRLIGLSALLACFWKKLARRQAYVSLFWVFVIVNSLLVLFTHRLCKPWLWGVRDKIIEESKTPRLGA